MRIIEFRQRIVKGMIHLAMGVVASVETTMEAYNKSGKVLDCYVDGDYLIVKVNMDEVKPNDLRFLVEAELDQTTLNEDKITKDS